jgi:hypothetical protein
MIANQHSGDELISADIQSGRSAARTRQPRKGGFRARSFPRTWPACLLPASDASLGDGRRCSGEEERGPPGGAARGPIAGSPVNMANRPPSSRRSGPERRGDDRDGAARWARVSDAPAARFQPRARLSASGVLDHESAGGMLQPHACGAEIGRHPVASARRQAGRPPPPLSQALIKILQYLPPMARPPHLSWL